MVGVVRQAAMAELAQLKRERAAGAELDHVAARFAVVGLQRADLGLQRVDQAAQLQEQQRRADRTSATSLEVTYQDLPVRLLAW